MFDVLDEVSLQGSNHLERLVLLVHYFSLAAFRIALALNQLTIRTSRGLHLGRNDEMVVSLFGTRQANSLQLVSEIIYLHDLPSSLHYG